MFLVHAPTIKYHLTHPSNQWDIKREGLRIERDARKAGRIWLCDLAEVGWVAEHLAMRDGYSYVQWMMFQVDTRFIPGEIKRSGRKGIYYTDRDVPPRYIERVTYVTVDMSEPNVIDCLT